VKKRKAMKVTFSGGCKKEHAPGRGGCLFFRLRRAIGIAHFDPRAVQWCWKPESHMKFATIAMAPFLFTSHLIAQQMQPAPASIADSLVEISSRVSVFSSYDLILCRADGTFQQIVSEGVTDTVVGNQTNAPSSGTYTYVTSPGPTGLQGTITFSAANPHDYGAVAFGGGSGGIDSPTVTVYSRSELTGAVNVSNNSWVSAGHPTIPGFVIQGNSPRWVLIRGDGPSLSQFGVVGPVAAPLMNFTGAIVAAPVEGPTSSSINVQTVVNAAGVTVSQTILPWSADPNLAAGFQAIFSLVGAFQFQSGSTDCAGLLLLAPGAYTIQGSSSGVDGELLTEVYVLPYSS
jgi:hypothetical protein